MFANLMMALAVLAGVCVIYFFLLRDWLIEQPWAAPFYDVVLPWEKRLLGGGASRTMLVARLYWLAGYVLAFHDALLPLVSEWLPILNAAGFDVTTLLPEPWGKLVGPALIVTGHLFAKLRKITHEPLDARE